MFINYEREIIMKIEVGPAELLSPLDPFGPAELLSVGPAELLSPLHPFSFFVFPLTVLTNPS
jgi:hypothetical protein